MGSLMERVAFCLLIVLNINPAASFYWTHLLLIYNFLKNMSLGYAAVREPIIFLIFICLQLDAMLVENIAFEMGI